MRQSVTFLAGHGEICPPHGRSTWRPADQPTTRDPHACLVWFSLNRQEIRVDRRVVGWSAGLHVDRPHGGQISPWPARKVTETRSFFGGGGGCSATQLRHLKNFLSCCDTVSYNALAKVAGSRLTVQGAFYDFGPGGPGDSCKWPLGSQTKALDRTIPTMAQALTNLSDHSRQIKQALRDAALKRSHRTSVDICVK